MRRDPVGHEERRQRLEHINRSQPPRDHDRQALPRILLHDREELQRAPVVRPVRDEVIGPDVVPIRRPTAHARPIRQPQTTALRLFPGHFQALPPPQPFHPLVISRAILRHATAR